MTCRCDGQTMEWEDVDNGIEDDGMHKRRWDEKSLCRCKFLHDARISLLDGGS